MTVIRTFYRIISTLETIICTRNVDLRKYYSCAMQLRRSIAARVVRCLLSVACGALRQAWRGCVVLLLCAPRRQSSQRRASCMLSIARCASRQADRAAYGTERRDAVRMVQMRRSRAVNGQFRPGQCAALAAVLAEHRHSPLHGIHLGACSVQHAAANSQRCPSYCSCGTSYHTR